MDTDERDSRVVDQAAEDALAAAARELLRRAAEDHLTGVYLRGPGWQELARAVDGAQRTGASLCVAFLDVDHLELRNDELGHAAGDELLREIGTALRASLRESDIIVRYGGDEFVCALPGIRRRDARRRLHDVAASLSRSIPGATFSTGLVNLRPREGLEDVVARADLTMYSDRRRRRDG